MADLSKIKLNGTTYNFKDAAARQSISNITNFNVQVVDTLPTTNIDTHTIYFISNNGSNNNIYDEFMYIGSAWEKIGTTDIDLSNYLQTSDIASWAKATNKPSYTAAEVGALPDTYTAPVTSVNGHTGAVTVTEYDDTALAARVTALENIPWVTYYTGSSTPSNSQGNNGDLYFQTAQ